MTHKNSFIEKIPEHKLIDVLDRIRSMLLIILHDNSIHQSVHSITLNFLIQIIERYYIKDVDYFQRPEQNINKLSVIENALTFISSKFKEINLNLTTFID